MPTILDDPGHLDRPVGLRARAPRALLLAGCLLVLSGCAITAEPVLPPPTRPPYLYVIGPDDVLAIEVWKEDELKRETVIVTPDGEISFPLAGTMNVKDKTLQEVVDMVTNELRVYFEDPMVTVELRQSRSPQIQVLGEVEKQGPVPYVDRLSLIQAISGADINWVTAKTESLRIVRGALDDPQLIAVDLDHVLGGIEKDIFLQPGDIVVVPPKYVTVVTRYLSQILLPLGVASGASQAALGTAIGAQRGP